MRISDWSQTCALPIYQCDPFLLPCRRCRSVFRLARLDRGVGIDRRGAWRQGRLVGDVGGFGGRGIALGRCVGCRHFGGGGRRQRQVRALLVQIEDQIGAILRVGKPGKGHLGAVGELARAREPRSEEHTSELQSLMRNSYAVFCLKKKNTPRKTEQKQNITLTELQWKLTIHT